MINLIRKWPIIAVFRNLLFVLSLAFNVSSCGPASMALTVGQDTADLSKKSIALLSVRISNQYKPSYQPWLTFIVIYPPSDTSMTMYKPKNAYSVEKEDSFYEYWLSFELNPGVNNFRELVVTYDAPFLWHANAHIWLNLDADIKPHSVHYLGHINAILRERKSDDEVRAAQFPFSSTAVIGFLTGTYDVVVEDKFDEDMKTFVNQYPALQYVWVEKSVLPQWSRQKSLQWSRPKDSEVK